MKMRLLKIFLALAVVFTVFSCNNGPKDVIYTIQLDAPDSTYKGTEKLYYNATNGMYYSSGEMRTPVLSITVPEKKWTIRINSPVAEKGAKEIVKEFVFGGYKDMSLGSKNTKEYIGSDGRINRNATVNKDLKLTADWGSEDFVIVTVGELKGNSEDLIPEGYELTGFKYNGKTLALSDNDSDAVTINSPDAEIDLDLKIKGGKELTLSSSGATKSGSKSKIFYKFQEKDGNNWFTSANWSEAITKLDTSELPEKKYEIKLDPNNGDAALSSLYTSFPFMGYASESGRQYIDPSGIINKVAGDDPIRDTGDRNAVLANAQFGSQEVVKLPSLEKNGYVFKGWSRNKNYKNDANGKLYQATEYVIEYNEEEEYPDEDNIIRLYAVWGNSAVYSLNLRDTADSGANLRTIYYRAGDTWYKDEACTEKLSNKKVSVPKRTSVIEYYSGRSDIRNPESDVYEWGFDGFKSNDGKVIYISSDGDVQNVTLSGNTICYAFWNADKSVKLPSSSSGFTHDDNYEFMGWSDDDGKTLINGTSYRMRTSSAERAVLSGIWKDLRVHTLTLDNQYADGDVEAKTEKLYYKPVTVYKYAYYPEIGETKRVGIETSEGWYRNSECTIAFEGFEADELPTRKYIVNYNINRDISGAKDRDEYLYRFGGYTSYIDESGDIIKDETGKRVRLNSSATARIKWNDGDGIVLPDFGQQNNERHVGWVRSGDNMFVGNPGDVYYPTQYKVNLTPVWESGAIYTLTLVADGATNTDYQRAIYYKQSDGKWYLSLSGSEAIDNISDKLPYRELRVSFNTVESDVTPSVYEDIVTECAFLGYGGYIDKDGRITAMSISDNVSAYVRWDEAEEIELPKGPVKDNLRFISWCEDKGGEKVAVSSPYVAKGDTELYAKFENLNRYTLTLDSAGATEGTNGSISYWMEDSSWHADITSGAVITKINKPKKVWTVELDVNNSLLSPLADRQSEFTFAGYKGADSVYYVDAAGNIVPGKAISSDSVTATAVWNEGSGVKLPLLTAPGFVFKGWSKVKGDESTLIPSSGNMEALYTPLYNKEKLYALWERDSYYKLKLDLDLIADSGIDYYTRNIYYYKGDGWYLDEEGTITANSIVIPVRKYKVDFESGLQYATKPERRETSFEFKGYGEYITPTGEVNRASSIASDVENIQAGWSDKPGAIALPVPETESASDRSYKFVGWRTAAKEGEGRVILKDSAEFNAYYPTSSATTLYGEWADTGVYTLTLDSDGATNEGSLQSAIYYQPSGESGKGWYSSSSAASTLIEEITLPKKEWSVSFKTTGPDGAEHGRLEPRVSKWEFLGYKDGNKEYVLSDGSIVSSSSISENSRVKALWGNQSAIDISRSVLRPGENPENYYFNGWALDSDNNNVVLPSSFVPERDNVVLKAVWTEEQTYEVVLNSDGATSEGTARVYYKPNDKKWHPEADTQSEITRITVPKKVWTIVHGSNKDGVENAESINYEFTFAGYYSGDVMYITPEGDFVEGVYPTGDASVSLVLTARWQDKGSVQLQTLSKKGYTFLGWSLSSTSLVSDIANPYMPQSSHVNGKTIPLYGVWKENDIYTLTLNPEGATTSGTKAIYYRVGDGWYKDRECTVGIKSVPYLPEKKYYVSYEPILQGIERPLSSESSFTFNGYNGYVLSGGAVIEGTSLSADTVVSAQWVNQGYVTLPSLESDNTKYTFIGWCEKNPVDADPEGGDNPVMAAGYQYRPSDSDKCLYAYWKDNNIYALHLDDNGATGYADAKDLYYRVSDGKWYKTSDATGSAVSSINPPKKRVTISFNTSAPAGSVTGSLNNVFREWEFLGYEDYIDENGNIKTGAAINSNRTVRAVWGAQKGYNSDGVTEGGALPTQISRSGYTFEGWTENKDYTPSVIVVNPYYPSTDGGTLDIRDGVITLYAVWRDESVIPLMLDSDGATKTSASAVYYKTSTGKWYSTGDNPKDKDIITGIEVPKKEATVTFSVSSKIESTPVSLTSRREFKGYYGSTDDRLYIDSEGIIQSLGIDKYTTAKAGWSEPSEISMPLGYTYPGWTFKGWSTTKGASEADYQPGATISVTKNMVLYDVWKENPTHTLTLNAPDVTSEGTTKLYYREGDTWYTDVALSVKSTNITIPKNSYLIKFDYNGGDGQTEAEATSQIEFLGYGNYVNKNGVIVLGAAIFADTDVQATWGVPQSITLPETSSVKREGYECVGWAEQKAETDDNKIYTGEWQPERNKTTLYAQWVSTKAIKVTFVTNGATISELSRMYLREADSKWYKTLTDKTSIGDSINIPKKSYSVRFITGLNGVLIKDESYLFTFGGYYTSSTFTGVPVISATGVIKSDFKPTQDTLLYAKWTPVTSSIDITSQNSLMMTKAIENTRYFVGWSKYSDGGMATVLTAKDGAPSDAEVSQGNPRGLPVKAKEFVPTTDTTLYAVMLNTLTYTVTMYDNTEWQSDPKNGKVQYMYYKPYGDMWYVRNGNQSDDAVKKALEYPTETIEAEIAHSSSYTLKHLNSVFTMPTKQASATFDKAWPDIAGHLDYSDNGWKMTQIVVDPNTKQETIQDLGESWTGPFTWNMTAKGYYTNDDMQLEWIPSTGIMNMEVASTITGDVTLVALWNTSADTWNTLPLISIAEGAKIQGTDRPFNYGVMGWSTKAPSSGNVPYSNADGLIESGKFAPTVDIIGADGTFTLYGVWYKIINEKLLLSSGVSEEAKKGTSEIYYEQSAMGNSWYYKYYTGEIDPDTGEEGYDTYTLSQDGEVTTTSIMIPQKAFDLKYSQSKTAKEESPEGQRPSLPAATTSGAKFLGYLNPDYDVTASDGNKSYKYIIDQRGVFTSGIFEKDSTRVGEKSKLDEAASIVADWGENAISSVTLGDSSSSAMSNFKFKGWSEIYGWDESGNTYFSAPTDESIIVSSPYMPESDLPFNVTLKTTANTTATYTISNMSDVKTTLVPAINTAALFYFEATDKRTSNELVREFLTSITFVQDGDKKAFKDRNEQNRIANAYYWAGTSGEKYVVKYDTTLYNVWDAAYTLAVLAPQNLLTAVPTPLTINDDGVITYNSYSTPTVDSGRTLKYTKNLYVSSTGNVSDNATGALLYLVLLEGDGTSEKVSKYVSFSDNFTANLHTIFPVTTTENVQDADGGTFTQTSLGSFKNNESKQTILSVENKIVVAGKVRALAVRLNGAITGGTAEPVALRSEYTKYISGGTSNNTAYSNVIFQKDNEIALSVENVTGFTTYDINLYKVYTGLGGVPISWDRDKGRPDPVDVDNTKYLKFTLQNAVFNTNGTLKEKNGIATLISIWWDDAEVFPTVSSTSNADFINNATTFKLYYSVYGYGNITATTTNKKFTLYPSVDLIKNLYDEILQIEAATTSPNIQSWSASFSPSVSQDTISGISGTQAGNSISVTWCKSWSGDKVCYHFEEIQNLDVTSWFTGLPAGITAKATAAEGSTELTITFEGTYPDKVKEYSSKLTIPYYDSNSKKGIIQGRMEDKVIKSGAQTIKFDIKEPTSVVISVDSSAKGSENTPYPTSDSIKLQNEISFTFNAPTGSTFTIPQTANTSSVSSTDPENSSLLLAETASNATTASINVTLSDNSPFLDNSGNKITTAVLEITEGSSTATLKIGNSITKVAPDLSLDYTDKAEVSVLGIPLGCLSEFKGYTGSATLLASVFYKVDKKLSFTALYGTNATESVLFASPGSSVNVQYMYIRPVLITQGGITTEISGITVTTGTEFSAFSKYDSRSAFANLWKDAMAVVSYATSPSTVLNSPKLGDIKAVTTSSPYILSVNKVSTSLSESLYTYNEVFATNDINSAYNVRVSSDITVDDFYKFRPEPATYDDSGSKTKIAGTVNNSAKNEIATVTMSMNNTPVSSNLPEYSFDIFTFNGATFSSTNLKAYVDTATVGNSGVTGIDIVKVSSTQAKAYLRGTMNTAGTYTIRFKVGEITYNSSVVSPYLTVNLQIINATVIPDGKLTFVSYNGGYKITGTTATFTQGTTYVIPTTYNGKPVVAIDNGGLGSYGQNGVFNTDSNSSTGQVGNYANNVNLTSIILPNSITELGVGTFHSRDANSKLKTVYLPYNLKVIPKYCFSDCSQLQKVVFPKALTTISKSAFYDCSGWLKGNQICGVLPKTLTTIQEGGFGRWNGAPSYLPLFEYEGTKAEFDSKVTVGSSNYFRIKCSDGNIYTISK